MKTFALVSATTALLAGSAAAQTHLITFDTDASGVAIPDLTTISNQYAGWGVTFTPNVYDPAAGWASNTDMTATKTDVGSGYTAGHANVLHSFGGWLNEDGDPDFAMTFTQPISALSIQFVGDTSGASEVDLFDAGGNFITSGLVGAADANGDKVVSFTGLDGLGVVQIGAVLPGAFLDWAGVDNIQFTYVPAPSSVALLGLGGFAMARRRRR
jgi:hypothetical protein